MGKSALVWRLGGFCAGAWLGLAAPACAQFTPPAIAANAANRQSWGVDAAALSAPPAALLRSGNPPLPAAAQAQIDAMRITREPAIQLARDMQAEVKAANALADPAQRQAAKQRWQQDMAALAREAATRSLLRDLYSPTQVQEQMAWFWFNHFNVHEQKREIRAMVGAYEDTLRAHALGRFRTLLEASLRSPAMLQYLDNDQNAAGHINENYAREIMELHSMGVGSGYAQGDVTELARILTGVGVRFEPDDPRLPPRLQPYYLRDGLMVFNPARHDFGDKHFLGHTIHGSGFAEVEQALDLIAAAPATRAHVSRQIAQFFMGDAVPPAVVTQMTAAWARSDGDIATVLRALFASPEYRAALASGGGAFKDPMHYAISAVRLAYDGRVIRNADPLIGWLRRLGEGLYDHETPDGYPLAAAAWDGPGQMETRFEIAKAIASGAPALFRAPDAGPTPAMMPAMMMTAGPMTPPAPAAPPPPSPPPRLQDSPGYTALAPTLAPATRKALAAATSQQEWNMLLLASPEFMRR